MGIKNTPVRTFSPVALTISLVDIIHLGAFFILMSLNDFQESIGLHYRHLS